MEITDEFISKWAKLYPGELAVYKILKGKVTVLFLSSGVPAIVGMAREEFDEVLKDDILQIVFEKDRSQISLMISSIIQTKEDGDITYRVKHKTKGFVWLHAKNRFLGMMDGAPVLASAFLETSLESEEQKILLDNSSAIIYVVDQKSHELLFANEVALKFWGHGNYAGVPCHKYINNLDAMCLWCSLPLMKNGKAHSPASFVPGINRWFDIDCCDMNWHGIPAIAIYAIDVTDRMKIQEEIKRRKEELERIIDNIPGGVGILHEENGTFYLDYANDGCFSVHHNTKENLLGARVRNVVYKPDLHLLIQEYNRIRVQQHACGEATYRVTGSDGSLCWVNVQFRKAFVKDEKQYYYATFADMDKQKSVEEEGKKIRLMYDSAAENVRLLIWEYDIDTHGVTLADNPFTKEVCRKFNVPKDIDDVLAFMKPHFIGDSFEKFLQAHYAIEQGAKKSSCEVWYKITTEQEALCELVNYTTIFDEDGKPVKAFGIGQNITAQKLEERKYNLMFQQFSESDPDSVCAFQLNLTKNICVNGKSSNPWIIKFLKLNSVDEHMKAVSLMILDNEKKQEFAENFNRIKLMETFQKGISQCFFEYPICFSSGDVHRVRTVANMIRNPLTGDIEATTLATDVTERKQNEDIIERLTRDSADFIGIIDIQQHIFEFLNYSWDCDKMQVNQKRSYEEMLRFVSNSYIDEPERPAFMKALSLELLKKKLSVHGRYMFTYNFYDGKGGTLKKQLLFTWLNSENEKIFVSQTDLTSSYEQEQKRLRELQDALHIAEAANKSKTEFVSRISHDIRTPISIGISMIDFAFEDIDNREKLINDLKKIKSSNTFLLSLINDVLDISKIDSGRMELKPEFYIYHDYVSNIRNMFEPLCAQNGITFSIEHKKEIPYVIFTDKTRINQISLNLLSNAVKYTPRGGFVSFVSDNSVGADGIMHFSFEVRDTGIGMSPEFQKNMFQPFVQDLHNVERMKLAGGTGLGLSIVKHIVDFMGGTISVKSGLGKGTVIRCDIPMRDASKMPGYESYGKDIPIGRQNVRELSGKVLLAEDNPMNEEIARRILENFGLKVDHAENGQKALELFKASKSGEYGAVLLDIQMPILDGYATSEMIRLLKRPDAKTIPIMAMTADAFEDAVTQAKNAGMNDFITKPLDPFKIFETLKQYM
ncbi:MAG: ATP-binding protein [Fibrobacteraceae bacterium]|nr:ATP-binding protein [Fibrobacteraceae bacterium]